MGLFNRIVDAVNSPEREASTGQLDTILSTVQALAQSQGIDPATTQMLASVVGRHVRSNLKSTRQNQSEDQAEALVNRYSGVSPNLGAVQALFNQQEQGQMVQEAAQKTGVNAGTIQAMLPILVPVILNLLKTGAVSQSGSRKSNSVLSAFLDTDRDGDLDIGDAMAMAGQYLNQNRHV
ncbi:MAG: hypothetical protein HC886_02475 [Leptolyngbyaceae cyanobacterium SM1_1_3]|nr:hypothetical protein [Leptolyngbyaceae cyanobacterium SM1_1_3]NJN03664.1 hypothetical protein [Leptolyngbyaceae cyanobacterium RM1_1_2]NJO09129.1 hypothetical protein [Leptolyngbyaceae cyanobacterium SL_1_1]